MPVVPLQAPKRTERPEDDDDYGEVDCTRTGPAPETFWKRTPVIVSRSSEIQVPIIS